MNNGKKKKKNWGKVTFFNRMKKLYT